MKSAKCGVVSPRTGPTITETTPRTRRKNATAPIAAPRPSQRRVAVRATPAASMTSIGLEDHPELRDAEVELDGEDHEADQEAAGEGDAPEPQ